MKAGHAYETSTLWNQASGGYLSFNFDPYFFLLCLIGMIIMFTSYVKRLSPLMYKSVWI